MEITCGWEKRVIRTNITYASLASLALCFQPRSIPFVWLLPCTWIRKSTDCFAVYHNRAVVRHPSCATFYTEWVHITRVQRLYGWSITRAKRASLTRPFSVSPQSRSPISVSLQPTAPAKTTWIRKNMDCFAKTKNAMLTCDRRIFVYSFCLINICSSLSDEANNNKTPEYWKSITISVISENLSLIYCWFCRNPLLNTRNFTKNTRLITFFCHPAISQF